MKFITIGLAVAPFLTSTPVLAKEIMVPKEINGQRVYYVAWSKKHASGSISTRTVRARFRRPIKVPYPYGNSKSCFLNSRQKIIACR